VGLFVVDVDCGRPGHGLDLDVGVLEEAEDAAGETLAATDDDGVGAQLALNLGDELLDRAPAVDAGGPLAAVAETGAGLATERFEQLPWRAHASPFGRMRREHEQGLR